MKRSGIASLLTAKEASTPDAPIGADSETTPAGGGII